MNYQYYSGEDDQEVSIRSDKPFTVLVSFGKNRAPTIDDFDERVVGTRFF